MTFLIQQHRPTIVRKPSTEEIYSRSSAVGYTYSNATPKVSGPKNKAVARILCHFNAVYIDYVL